ncbi:hypothetical protein [Parapedobacter sp. 2B3]|uniref:hypothetical protein n=1 Tax=Parapedobacter sp. 2B3 TaxID=3342381 RepID=UPI0035B64049
MEWIAHTEVGGRLVELPLVLAGLMKTRQCEVPGFRAALADYAAGGTLALRIVIMDFSGAVTGPNAEAGPRCIGRPESPFCKVTFCTGNRYVVRLRCKTADKSVIRRVVQELYWLLA